MTESAQRDGWRIIRHSFCYQLDSASLLVTWRGRCIGQKRYYNLIDWHKAIYLNASQRDNYDQGSGGQFYLSAEKTSFFSKLADIVRETNLN